MVAERCRWRGAAGRGSWMEPTGSRPTNSSDQAQRLLPPQVQPVLLADRGLTSPKLIKLACQRGWDYVLRVQSETTLRTAPRGARLARLDELVPRPGAPNVFIEGWVFAKHTTWVHIAAVWC